MKRRENGIVKMLVVLNSFLFVFSMSMIFLVFLFPPSVLWIAYLIKGKRAIKYSSTLPSISLIIVVRNAEGLIEDKIKNSISLNYPPEIYEIMIFSDGSTDETERIAKSFNDNKVLVLSSYVHEGKNSAINRAVQSCSGEVLVFTDVDVTLEPDALIKLVKYFVDSEVGGVCGNKVIVEDNNKLKEAQSIYTRFVSKIKELESQLGSISSNDGTLYAIRRKLFKSIPPAVTDDLYVCLSVIRQNHRFLFEPDAKAFMMVPSKNPKHEIARRRRIVSTSLRGIFLLKELLNPFKYGIFSISLFINKVFRRLLPVFLFLLFVSNIYLYSYNYFFKLFLFLQIVFYLLAFSYWFLFQSLSALKFARNITSLAFYFCIGNYGTFLGLVDFALGRKITKWEPYK